MKTVTEHFDPSNKKHLEAFVCLMENNGEWPHWFMDEIGRLEFEDYYINKIAYKIAVALAKEAIK